MSDYYCPNCNADLGNQPGFDPDSNYWICAECGVFLTDPDMDQSGNRFEDVGWFCDDCGALLNEQSGFSDWCGYWTCTECGHENRIEEDEIISNKNPSILDSVNSILESVNSVLEAFVPEDSEEDENTYDEDDEIYDSDEEESSYEAYVNEDTENDEEVNPVSDNNVSESTASSNGFTAKIRSFSDIFNEFLHKLKVFCCCIGCFILLIGVGILCYKADAYFNGITIGYDATDMPEMEYGELKELLSQKGFKYIVTSGIEDLEYHEDDKVNHVARLEVGENEVLDKNDRYSRFSKITIIYHLMKKAELPLSSKEAKGQDYLELKQLFIDAGFGNVEIEADYDISLAWFAKAGEVETVTVAGSKKFDSDAKYEVNTPVHIVYHANKKDQN